MTRNRHEQKKNLEKRTAKNRREKPNATENPVDAASSYSAIAVAPKDRRKIL